MEEDQLPNTISGKAVLSFFPKTSFYKGQKEAIEEIDAHFSSGKRYVILEGPTGTGKSAIAITLSRKYGSFLLTPQKILQNQYENDYPEIAVVKGRNTYACDLVDVYADVAPCVENKKKTCDPCVLKSDGGYRRENDPPGPYCAYASALDIGSTSHVTLFNFHSFYAHNKSDRFPPRPLLCIDEAHGLEGLAMDLVQLTLTDKIFPLVKETSIATLMDKFLPRGPYLLSLKEKISDLSIQLKVLPHGADKTTCMRKVAMLDTLTRRILFIRKLYEGTLKEDYDGPTFEEQWLMQTEMSAGQSFPNKIVLKPIFPGVFIPNMFLNRGDRVLFMSATILDKDTFCRSVGISPDETAFVSVPCHFPVINRLIHVYPCGNLSYKSYDYGIPRVLEGIRRIMALHKGQRGIIHTHSWKVLKDIQKGIKDPRFIFQDPKMRDREEYLRILKSSNDGVVVAPAMHEGLDLKDDWSRFQIIVKIPWPDFSDPQVKARANVDPSWCVLQPALKLVQESGRSVRSAEDWASTYILDSAFFGFYARSKILNGQSILPAWYREALRIYKQDETTDFLSGKSVPCKA